MADKSRPGSTNDATAHLEKVARQRHAAAKAIKELTPQDSEIEAAREAHIAKYGIEVPFVYGQEVSPPLDGGVDNGIAEEELTEEDPATFIPMRGDLEDGTTELSHKLAEAVQPVIDAAVQEQSGPSVYGAGRAYIQWVVAEGDEDNVLGYQFVLSVQVDDQAPGHVAFDLTPEMLDKWAEGVGLQKNRVGHRQFAAGIIEKAIEMSSFETGNNLIYTLEQIMLERAQEAEAAEEEYGQDDSDD